MFELPKLGYSFNALEPFIDEETMNIHYSKHHQAYLNNFNNAIKGTGLETKTIEEILSNLNSVPDGIKTQVRNHGGGYYHHSFFWKCLSPESGGEPQGELAEAINAKFNSFNDFKEAFSNSAKTVFGSGWTWLTQSSNGLEIMNTPNQDSPLNLGKKPLLALDVWEHAYYLKYQNRRPEYIEAFWNITNWKHVENEYKNK
ncbi:MAG: superoxide dismutase [Candidatus Micrarchaeota archaeon]